MTTRGSIMFSQFCLLNRHVSCLLLFFVVAFGCLCPCATEAKLRVVVILHTLCDETMVTPSTALLQQIYHQQVVATATVCNGIIRI